MRGYSQQGNLNEKEKKKKKGKEKKRRTNRGSRNSKRYLKAKKMINWYAPFLLLGVLKLIVTGKTSTHFSVFC